MPPQGATQTIQLRVEGDAAGTDELAAPVMVSLDNGANYKSVEEKNCVRCKFKGTKERKLI